MSTPSFAEDHVTSASDETAIADTTAHSFTNAEGEKALRYWTTDRIQTMLDSTSDNTVYSVGFSPDSTSHATGLLAYQTPNGLYGCSASLVNSTSRKLVVTAAHCLHGGKGASWYSNFVFYPDYPDSQDGLPISTVRVFATWTNDVQMTNGHIQNADIRHDVGFATINTALLPANLQSPANTYGSYDFGHAGLTSFEARIVGYPSNPGANRVRQYCTTTVAPKYFYFDTITADGCIFTDLVGASGGPWIQHYNPDNGSGWINGVTSTHEGTSISSPRFTNRVYALFNTSNADD